MNIDLDTADISLAAGKLKKFSFSKSWQNNFVAKARNLIDPETGEVANIELNDFIYIPAPAILQYLVKDRDFLNYRQEHKFSDRYNFKLLPDKTENNNRRVAIMYMADLLRETEMKFYIDEAFTLYITAEELQKINRPEEPILKDLYFTLAANRIFGSRKGAAETFS